MNLQNHKSRVAAQLCGHLRPQHRGATTPEMAILRPRTHQLIRCAGWSNSLLSIIRRRRWGLSAAPHRVARAQGRRKDAGAIVFIFTIQGCLVCAGVSKLLRSIRSRHSADRRPSGLTLTGGRRFCDSGAVGRRTGRRKKSWPFRSMQKFVVSWADMGSTRALLCVCAHESAPADVRPAD